MKRVKKYKSLLSAIIASFICMVGGITVFAYQPPSTITNESIEIADTTDFFIREKNTVHKKLVSDYFAVSNDGTNYDLSYADKNAKIACTHNYSVQVEVTKHIKNSNGGCTMKTYNGLKCSKCNDIKYDELLYTATYMPCPH